MTGDGREQARQIATIRMQPLADVYQAMLRYATVDGAQVLFGGEPDLLDILRDPELRSSLELPRSRNLPGNPPPN